MKIESCYVSLRSVLDGEVARTVDLGDLTHMDLDAQGRVLGIETIGHDVDLSVYVKALMWFGTERQETQ